MIVNHLRRKGVHLFVAFASTGLISAAPVQADIPKNVIQAVEIAQDPVAPVAPPIIEETVEQATHIADGHASYYGSELAGNRTASGERFNPRALTAAHRTLPLGTKVRVTNQANGKSVIVRINDRGPFVKSRLIDVSYAAAQQISMIRSGHARVRLDRIA
jgi:rare lipoprotein A